MDLHVQFFCRHMFSFLMIIYLCTKMLSHMVILWLNFKEILNCFPKWLHVLHSQQQCMRISVSSYLHQHMLLFFFLILATLVAMKCYLSVVFICISLMANDNQHLFMCLFAFCIFSLVKKKKSLHVFAQLPIGFLYICCVYIF